MCRHHVWSENERPGDDGEADCRKQNIRCKDGIDPVLRCVRLVGMAGNVVQLIEDQDNIAHPYLAQLSLTYR